MLKLKYVITVLLLNSFILTNVVAVIIFNLQLPTTKYGFVYPNRGEPNKNVTYVLEGVDVLIHLARVPEDFTACKLTTPDTEFTYTLLAGSTNNDKAVFWAPNSNPKQCGARIKNVTVNDSGRWKLQAVNAEGDYKIQSFINLQVIKNFDRPNGNFEIRNGKDTELNITYLANYCQVSSPHLSNEYNVYDQCTIELGNINKLYGGKWKVSVGVFGKIDEIQLEPTVTVLEEVFDVGYNKSGSKINLYCNLKNPRNITELSFCRFVKDGEDVGLRLSEGLSNGKYSYYGKSFKDGDCGVTIENPNRNDYVSWKCSIGIYINKGDKKMEKFQMKESIISLSKLSRRHRRALSEKASEETPEEEIEEVLAANDNPLILYYKSDFRIKYCIIKHPNGTLFSINNDVYQNDGWSPFGNLDLGECGMKLKQTTTNESGIWQYQLGHYSIHELDEVKKIRVRVGNTAIVAVEQNITTSLDTKLTLKCKSVAEVKTLEYCRFSLPDGSGFQINEEATEDNPIDDMYWYNSKYSSLQKGICQVTIKTVSPKHFGRWLCAGKILGSKHSEDFDYINVSPVGLTIASISGIIVGAGILIIAAGGGFIYYNKKKRQQPQRRQTYLSSTSHSSGEITHYQRADPLYSMEEEVQTTERVDEHEEIEMSSVQEPELEPETSKPTTFVTSM